MLYADAHMPQLPGTGDEAGWHILNWLISAWNSNVSVEAIVAVIDGARV
jgi:hypothetical protein